jgi:predicted dehydrogenase
MVPVPDHRPHVPVDPPTVGLIGAGAIARSAHLPAYAAWGIPVAAVASRSPEAARALATDFDIRTVHGRVEDLLADPVVQVVDIATGPDGRVDLIASAIAAGKHVLSQKPLSVAVDELPRLRDVLVEADERGLRIAVNQNARWAPAWRVATLLVRDGVVGDVVGVTHLHDKPLPPLAGTSFDDVPHMLLTDYLVHWIDITRCWLEGTTVETVSAHDTRVPGQPAQARNPWHAELSMLTDSGASASLRVVGDARASTGGCPFWIHGTEGTIRGSVLRDSDAVELDRAGTVTPFPLETAIVEQREPENSAAHVLATVRIGQAAVASANSGGSPVHPDDLVLTRATTRKAENA